jgi:hypothetical protein
MMDSAMSHRRHLLLLSVMLLLPALAHSQEARPADALSADRFDTEHIFGFAEGSDIGPPGEAEIESFTVGSFGATGGNFTIGNDTSARYTLSEQLRLSVGALTDYFHVGGVPGLLGHGAAEFSGVTTEARWNILNWRTSPFGMSLSIDPEWRRADAASARQDGNYGVTTALLIDKEVIPETFFAALNLIHSASFLPFGGKWEHDDAFSVIVSGAYAITPDLVVGAEIIHENLAQNGSLNAHALFVGPQLFLRLNKDVTASMAWAVQIPDAAARQLDVVNFERHQLGLRFAYDF